MAGGASVGDHDYARTMFKSLGVKLLVEKVNVQPGKPTWFGLRDGKMVLGMPGNPASALVCARLFLKPLLTKMLGSDAEADIATQAARLFAGPAGERAA